MAEKEKKAKAPAKPRSSAAKTKTMAGRAKAAAPSQQEIARLAHAFWAERGWQHGYAEQDWFRAEEELLGLAS